jgi:hypothetical protein
MYFNLLYIHVLIINAHVGEWSPHVPLKKFKKAANKNALKNENRDPKVFSQPHSKEFATKTSRTLHLDFELLCMYSLNVSCRR